MLKNRLTWPLALLALLVAASGCDSESNTDANEGATTSEPPNEIDRFAQNPQAYDGQSLTLSGEVTKIYGDNAFILTDEDDPLEIWEGGVLILTRDSIVLTDQGLEAGDDLIVTGTAHRFVATQIEEQLGRDLQPEIEAEFAEVPVLLATGLIRVNKEVSWNQGEPPVVNDLRAITTANPADDLVGVRVQSDEALVVATTDDAIWLAQGDMPPLKVVPGQDTLLAEIDAGDHVAITGTLGRPSVTITVPDVLSFAPLQIEATNIEEIEEKNGEGLISYERFTDTPGRFIGDTVQGEATVERVISDRAFWLEHSNGEQSLGVVREDVPQKEMIDIDAGDTLRFTSRVVGSEHIDRVAGPLEEDSREAINKEEAFLAMHWNDVEFQ